MNGSSFTDSSIKTGTRPFAASSIYGVSSVLLKMVLTMELITTRCFFVVNLSFVALLDAKLVSVVNKTRTRSLRMEGRLVLLTITKRG